ncbi:hypothetical protein KQX54_012831 [Cotesia glomerata]|uniref:ZSWIM3 N-terminal domain-containing protein n=1 Tax=Cotesia glomerata TaxID=32391 RepID=A0AAV7ILG9_COTGL|nr:hypothetical protein KQX54_012831 [Cotesia glomerata]
MESPKYAVGDTFHVWEDFEKIFKKYCKETHQTFGVSDSKTIQAANLKMHINDDLKYYKRYYKCTRAGIFSSKGNNKRQRQSEKIDCPVRLFLKASRDGNTLVITEFNDQHNHPLQPVEKQGKNQKRPKQSDPQSNNLEKENIIPGISNDNKMNEDEGLKSLDDRDEKPQSPEKHEYSDQPIMNKQIRSPNSNILEEEYLEQVDQVILELNESQLEIFNQLVEVPEGLPPTETAGEPGAEGSRELLKDDENLPPRGTAPESGAKESRELLKNDENLPPRGTAPESGVKKSPAMSAAYGIVMPERANTRGRPKKQTDSVIPRTPVAFVEQNKKDQQRQILGWILKDKDLVELRKSEQLPILKVDQSKKRSREDQDQGIEPLENEEQLNFERSPPLHEQPQEDDQQQEAQRLQNFSDRKQSNNNS